MKPPSQTYPVVRWRGGRRESGDDIVAVEEPLEIRVDGTPLAVTMRTPGNDDELAAGFCLTEAIVGDGDEIVRVDFCSDAENDNVVDVRLDERGDSQSRQQAIERARRYGFLSSSCGICGVQSLDRVEQIVRPFAAVSFPLSYRWLARLPARMRRRQAVFARTGGLHSAALFSGSGSSMTLREDVGRHNAVDKVIGHRLLMGTRRRSGDQHSAQGAALMVSGRASFEIVQKAAVAGIPIVIAVGAPSSLAVDLARRLDMTLVGFLRGERLNVYCGADRIAEQ